MEKTAYLCQWNLCDNRPIWSAALSLHFRLFVCLLVQR
nr:MAG TPA: hypothetical protein [Caudoviricetes sp.]